MRTELQRSGRFCWRVLGDDGADLITVDGTSNDDFVY